MVRALLVVIVLLLVILVLAHERTQAVITDLVIIAVRLAGVVLVLWYAFTHLP